MEEKCAYIRGRAEQKRPKQKSSREHERKRIQSFFFFLFQFQAEKKLEVGRVNSLFSQEPLLYSAMYFFVFSPFQKERGREKPRKAEWHEPLSIRWNVYDGTWEERMSWSVK